MDGRLLGTILWVNDLKGYGEIQDSLGQRYFFLLSECKIAVKELVQGKRVTFEKTKSVLFGKSKVGQILLLTEIKIKSKAQKVRRGEVGA